MFMNTGRARNESEKLPNDPIRNKKTVQRQVPPDGFLAITYNCKHCCKGFGTQTGLQNHVYRKHKDSQTKPFSCNSCSKAFLSAASLWRHKRQEHLGIFRHKCQICGRGFGNKNDLTGHLVMHGAERQYVCIHCGKSYSYKQHLQRHVSENHL